MHDGQFLTVYGSFVDKPNEPKSHVMMVLLKSAVFFKDLNLQEVYSTFLKINKSNL